MKMRYIGSDHPELVGQTALVDTAVDGKLRAQFDDTTLRSDKILEVRSELHRVSDSHGGKWWGFGWHELPADDFEPVEKPREAASAEEFDELVQHIAAEAL